MTTRHGPLGQHLNWLLSNASAWRWRWASSFAGGAEHCYVVRGKELATKDYERAFRTVMAFGQARKFHRNTNIELAAPSIDSPSHLPYSIPIGTGIKFWPMSHQASVSKVLNSAPMRATYGTQNAPATATPYDVDWDWTAPDWEDQWQLSKLKESMGALIWKLAHGPDTTRQIGSLLDLAPRIGWAYDLKLVSPSTRYLGLEPSQGMQNQFAYRLVTGTGPFKTRSSVRPTQPLPVSPEDALFPDSNSNSNSNSKTSVRSGPALPALSFGEVWDLAIALFGQASYLTPRTIRELPALARRSLLMFLPPATTAHPFDQPRPSDEALRAALALPGIRKGRLGSYIVVEVGHD